MPNQKNWNVIGGIAAVAGIIIASILIFLFTSDDGYSGAQALKQQSAGFWIGIAVSFGVAILGLIVLIKSEKSAWGTTGFTLGLVIVIVLLLFGPFGRACTDKANAGITAPKHEVGK